MPYKHRVTKKCSECGNVLETVVDHFCDGCGKTITEQKEDYNNQIRIGLLPEDHESHIDDLVFCNLDCYLENFSKINLKGVGNISIEFMTPTLYKKLMTKLLGEKIE